MLDVDRRLARDRTGPFELDLDAGAQIGDGPHLVFIDQRAHVGLAEVLQVVSADEPIAPGAPAVDRRQIAKIAHIDRTVEVDPSRCCHWVNLTDPSSDGQNAASETSISELSVDSATVRRAASSGSTVDAKNRATAGLPS
jgi:hypothetical protein